MLKNVHIVIIAVVLFLVAYLILSFPLFYSICISIVLISGFLAFNLFNIRRTLFVKSISRIKTDEKVVFFTFDDGPISGTTERILDILKTHDIKATFFCIGERVEANPELVLKMFNEGHIIGIHTFRHSWQDALLSPKNYASNIDSCTKAIEKIIGKKPLLFRPPFGITNPNIASALKASKLACIGWNVRSFDTISNDKCKLLNRILSKLKPGCIILMHDTLQITAEVLPELIQNLQDKGYKILSLQQFIEMPIYE